jgi:hypothetical protein
VPVRTRLPRPRRKPQPSYLQPSAENICRFEIVYGSPVCRTHRRALTANARCPVTGRMPELGP